MKRRFFLQPERLGVPCCDPKLASARFTSRAGALVERVACRAHRILSMPPPSYPELCEAAYFGDHDQARKLLATGSSVFDPQKVAGSKILQREEYEATIFSSGEEMHTDSLAGQIALHTACHMARPEVVRLLLAEDLLQLWTWPGPTMDSRRSCQPAAQTSSTAPCARLTRLTVQSAYGCCSTLAHRSTLSFAEGPNTPRHLSTLLQDRKGVRLTLSMQPNVRAT